ncbi:hypothetical protein V5N11_018154 [Cardamine amara subsp. amara]|uniref:DUF1764 domain-containing protein n=1 Tax=Cardamine amara subsp. amara TaxID=228776 RepID=A0ABD1ADY0_CARAN
MLKKMKTSTTSLKKSLKVGDKPEIQLTKQVPKPGKFGAEIDDIFGGRNKKKPQLEIPEKNDTKVEIAKWNTKKKKKTSSTTTSLKKPDLEIPEKKDSKVEIAKLKRKRKRNELDDGFNNTSKRRSRKRTVEGFLVYTEDELCVNKSNAGSTRLCPFDCNCCF